MWWFYKSKLYLHKNLCVCVCKAEIVIKMIMFYAKRIYICEGTGSIYLRSNEREKLLLAISIKKYVNTCRYKLYSDIFI